MAAPTARAPRPTRPAARRRVIDLDDPTTYDPPAVGHSPGFDRVRWHGAEYAFATPEQRTVVAMLWRAWVRGSPYAEAELLREAVAAPGQRLRDLFDAGRHPAWGALIRPAVLSGGPPGHYLLHCG